MRTLITREQIISELKRKGYKVKASDVKKNSITLNGISIMTDTNVSPVIYLDNLLTDDMTLDEAVYKIEQIYMTHKSPDIDFLALITNKDWVQNHLFIGLQKNSDEQLIKKSCSGCFNGLEQYIYIRDKNTSIRWSIKLNTNLLEELQISEKDVWEYAKTNTFSDDEATIRSLNSLLFEITGCSDFDDIAFPPLFVLSNKCMFRGSIQILNSSFISSFVQKLTVDTGRTPVKLAVLPASLHEVLIYPIFSGDVFTHEDENYLTNMVKEVNASAVDPVDKLSDNVYILSL